MQKTTGVDESWSVWWQRMHTPRIQADNEKCMSLTAIESNTAELKSITARFKELDELEVAIRKERAALQERERAIKVEFSMGQYNIRKHPHFTAELLRGVLVGTGLEHVMPILETVGRYAQHLSDRYHLSFEANALVGVMSLPVADSESVVSAVVWNAPIEVDGRDTTDLPRNVVQCVSYSILKNEKLRTPLFEVPPLVAAPTAFATVRDPSDPCTHRFFVATDTMIHTFQYTYDASQSWSYVLHQPTKPVPACPKVSVLAGSEKRGGADGIGGSALFDGISSLVISTKHTISDGRVITTGIAAADDGNNHTASGMVLFVCDQVNHQIRCVDVNTRRVITVQSRCGLLLDERKRATTPQHIAMDQLQPNLLWVCGGSRISSLDVTSGAVVQLQFPSYFDAAGMCALRSGQLLVLDRASIQLLCVDLPNSPPPPAPAAMKHVLTLKEQNGPTGRFVMSENEGSIWMMSGAVLGFGARATSCVHQITLPDLDQWKWPPPPPEWKQLRK